MQKTLRIYQSELSALQKQNLFWVKAGRGYYFEGQVIGELAARALRFLGEQMAMKALEEKIVDWEELFQGAEECFYLDPIVSLRQIGKVKIGNVRIWSKKLQKFAAGSR